jgi:hypothetical protein
MRRPDAWNGVDWQILAAGWNKSTHRVLVKYGRSEELGNDGALNSEAR